MMTDQCPSSSLLAAIFGDGVGADDSKAAKNQKQSHDRTQRREGRDSKDNDCTVRSSSAALFDQPDARFIDVRHRTSRSTRPPVRTGRKRPRDSSPRCTDADPAANETQRNLYNDDGGDGSESDSIVEDLIKRRTMQATGDFVESVITVPAPSSDSITTRTTASAGKRSSPMMAQPPFDVQVQEIADIVREYGVCVVKNVFRRHDSPSTAFAAEAEPQQRYDILSACSKKANKIEREMSKAIATKKEAKKKAKKKRKQGSTTRSIVGNDTKPHCDGRNDCADDDHDDDLFRYYEAASRCKGRIDTRYKTDLPPFNDERIVRNTCVLPIIQHLLTRKAVLVYAGLIFSYPGDRDVSIDQPWHQDGEALFPDDDGNSGAGAGTSSIAQTLPPYAINVFIPLSQDDCSVYSGPTEFVPQSHKINEDIVMKRLEEYFHHRYQHRRANQRKGSPTYDDGQDDTDSDDDGIIPTVISPLLCRGDVLLYDYRICHRGTRNITHRMKDEDTTKKAMSPSEDTTRIRSGGVGKIRRSKDKALDGKVGVGDIGSQQPQGTVRRILYLMYARPWYNEHVNFGSERLFD